MDGVHRLSCIRKEDGACITMTRWMPIAFVTPATCSVGEGGTDFLPRGRVSQRQPESITTNRTRHQSSDVVAHVFGPELGSELEPRVEPGAGPVCGLACGPAW
jgi:hypothetical protein